MLLTTSHLTKKNLLLVTGLFLQFWTSGKDLQYFLCVSNFCTYLYQIISNLLGRPMLDIKGNMLYFWSRDGIQIFTIYLVLDFLIGRHLIPLFARNCSVEIAWDFIIV